MSFFVNLVINTNILFLCNR